MRSIGSPSKKDLQSKALSCHSDQNSKFDYLLGLEFSFLLQQDLNLKNAHT